MTAKPEAKPEAVPRKKIRRAKKLTSRAKKGMEMHIFFY